MLVCGSGRETGTRPSVAVTNVKHYCGKGEGCRHAQLPFASTFFFWLEILLRFRGQSQKPAGQDFPDLISASQRKPSDSVLPGATSPLLEDTRAGDSPSWNGGKAHTDGIGQLSTEIHRHDNDRITSVSVNFTPVL